MIGRQTELLFEVELFLLAGFHEDWTQLLSFDEVGRLLRILEVRVGSVADFRVQLVSILPDLTFQSGDHHRLVLMHLPGEAGDGVGVRGAMAGVPEFFFELVDFVLEHPVAVEGLVVLGFVDLDLGEEMLAVLNLQRQVFMEAVLEGLPHRPLASVLAEPHRLVLPQFAHLELQLLVFMLFIFQLNDDLLQQFGVFFVETLRDGSRSSLVFLTLFSLPQSALQLLVLGLLAIEVFLRVLKFPHEVRNAGVVVLLFHPA